MSFSKPLEVVARDAAWAACKDRLKPARSKFTTNSDYFAFAIRLYADPYEQALADGGEPLVLDEHASTFAALLDIRFFEAVRPAVGSRAYDSMLMRYALTMSNADLSLMRRQVAHTDSHLVQHVLSMIAESDKNEREIAVLLDTKEEEEEEDTEPPLNAMVRAIFTAAARTN